MTRIHALSIACCLAISLACRPEQGSSPASEAEPPLPAGIPDPEAQRFAAPIEDAHGMSAWYEKEVLSTRITVTFGGRTLLDARLRMTPDVSRTRLDRSDGVVALWNGSDVRLSPAEAEFPRARFHALTWPYFLSAPMKLRDPGTYLEPLGERTLRGESYAAARLTFGPGVGDTRAEWYVVYRDPETDRLHAMAYVVPEEATLDEAGRDPQAIVYGGFERIDGVLVSTEWTFWSWSEERGIHGEPIGSARLEDVGFVELEDDTFAAPAGAPAAADDPS